MTLDVTTPLRRIKPEKHLAQLTPRARGDLIGVLDIGWHRRPSLMLDTNVYILFAAGRLSESAEELLDTALVFHCSVCIGELMAGVANADPGRPSWKTMRDYYHGLVAQMPDSRILAPDPQVWAEAGMVAGTLARTQRFQPHQRKECMNDALIYLTAAKAGVSVLTANREDFDFIQQVVGTGRFVYL